MQIKRFGLGIRFDMLDTELNDNVCKWIFEEIFSVITCDDIKGMMVYGGRDNTAEDENIYVAAITGGSLSRMQKIFAKIDDDAGIGMYLAHSHPFIENNRLSHVEGLTYFGTVQSDGSFKDGTADCFGIKVPKKHGKNRPVGRGIRILVAPDSFKGTLTSDEAIRRVTFAARRHFPGCKIVPLPIADGGEGTVKSLVSSTDGAYRTQSVTGPMGGKVNATYGVIHAKTAVIEMAAASGITLVSDDKRDVMAASTYGTGELIRRALDEGLRKFLIGIGGSATNDGGMGCARALGVKFFDADGNELMGCGGDLIKVDKIDLEYLNPHIREAQFTVMCDVTNPLTGETGATRIYAPQKGADAVQLEQLEQGMVHFGKLLSETVGMPDLTLRPGAGAAGGLGAMLMAILDPTVKRGIDAMLEAVDFQKMLKGVALVVTGEGRLDTQSVRYGKVVSGIMQQCAVRKIPVAVITGSMGPGADELYALGNAGVMTTVNAPMTLDMAISDALDLFDNAADRMFRFIRMGRDVEKIGAPKKPRFRPWPPIAPLESDIPDSSDGIK